MSLVSLGVRTTNFTINQACFEMRSAATTRPRLLELSMIQATATAMSLGVGRPAAIGVTPTSPVTMLRDEVADPVGTTQIALAWATSPTAPVAYHRRYNTAATIGVGMIFTSPRGFVVPISSSWVIFNITASVAMDVNANADE
jgi:hypothetical protein